MKKVLKVIGIIILSVVVLIAGLLFFLSIKPAAPNNYIVKTETGGELEAKYLSLGQYKTSHLSVSADEPMKKYTIYYPSELKNSVIQYPAVIMVNGTGVPATKYKTILNHLASWGFVVIGNEDPSSGNGNSTDQTLMYLLSENENSESIFYHKIDTENIGLEGHSQGGGRCFLGFDDQ